VSRAEPDVQCAITNVQFQQNFIEARVNKHYTKLLIDSGSNYSIVNKRFVNDVLQMSSVHSVENPRKVLTASGQLITLSHCVNLTVSVAGMPMPYDFYVTDAISSKFTVILGLDFLRSYNCNLDFVNNVITFDNSYGVTAALSSNAPGTILVSKSSYRVSASL